MSWQWESRRGAARSSGGRARMSSRISWMFTARHYPTWPGARSRPDADTGTAARDPEGYVREAERNIAAAGGLSVLSVPGSLGGPGGPDGSLGIGRLGKGPA